MEAERYALRVLMYEEEGEWIALVLEMDLRGYGATEEEALREVGDLVVNQIAFAKFKGQPELIWHPAEDKFFSQYNEESREELRRAVFGHSRPPEPRIQSLPVPEPHVIAEVLERLRLIDAGAV